MRLRNIPLRLNRMVREFRLRSGYDARNFWECWGRVFQDEEYQTRILPQHSWLLEQIEALHPTSVLEVGCGFGRNMKFLAEHGKKVVGLDISHSMLKNARNGGGAAQALLVNGRADQLPFADLSFELVFTMGLCMHVTPLGIRSTLREFARVAKRDILLIEEWYEDRVGPVNKYTFVHKYADLMRELKIAINSQSTVRNREQLLCIHGQRENIA